MNLKKLCLILMAIMLLSSLNSVDIKSNPDGTNIIITEVLYDTPGTDSDEEWLELYNPTATSISLSGWTLTDNAGTYTLSGTVPANGYFTIARVAAGFNALYGFDPDLSGMSLYLGNSGDQLILKDNNGIEVDFVAWEGYVTGWDVSAYHTTIYRPSEVDTDTVSDWVDSGTIGDPGTGPYGGGGGGDTTPPTVTITNPSDGARVNGTITITFDASDASGIDTYELYIDNSLKGTTTSYVWDTTLESEGTHQIKARARDTVGNWGEDIISVSVDNIATPAGAVKIMTYNIKESGEDPAYPDWKAVVQEENADIIMFVETGTWDDNNNAKLDQYVGEFNSYFTTEDPYTGYCTQGITYSTSGEAIMSRYPVVSTTQIATVTLDDGTIYDVTHDFFDAVVSIGDYNVHIIGAHLKAIPGADNEQRREWEMEGIINYMDDLGNVPIIYLGDLNSFSPEDWGLNTLQSGLGYGPLSMIVPPYTNPETGVDYSQYAPASQSYTDVFRTLNPSDLGITNPAYDSRIDFVWVNQLLSDKIIESTAGDTASALTGSDHLTVDVVVDFGTANDTIPPAQVTGLSATAVSGSQIDLNWDANSESDFDHYKIYRDGTFITTTTTSSYTDTGLTSETTYTYEISAVDLSGNEGLKSTSASATTLDVTAPAQVTGLVATAINASQIDLSWSANSEVDLDFYTVYRDGVLLTTTITNSYSDTGLIDGTTYTYEVSATDTSGNEGSKSAAASATTSDITPPSQVTGLSAIASSSTQVDLTWAANTESDLDYYKIYRDGVFIATSIINSYNDTGLTSETTYSYEVSAVDLSGNEGTKSSAVIATTPDANPPSQVTGLSASAVSGSQIDLSWIANSESDLDYYKVYRDGVFIATTSTNSYSDTGLTSETTYTYEVSAVDLSGNEGLKSVSASATTFDVTPPAQVTGLTATATSGSQIDLTWDTNSESDLDYYKIYRDGVLIATISSTSYSDTGLTSETTYVYEVSAVDLAGNEGVKSTSASATTLDVTPPSQVTGLTAIAVSGSQVDLNWDANSDSDINYYNIYRGGILIATTTATSYSDTGLTSETTYVYEVSAVDMAGNEGSKSISASATTLDVTPPSQVTGLSATAVSGSQIDLTWDANLENDLSYYTIYRDGVFLTTVNTNSYSDTGLIDGTAYTYEVSATDTSGNEGLKSVAASATTFDITPPAQVTGLTATATSGSQIDLAWNTNSESDLDYYNIYRDGVLIATTSSTSYSDTGLTSETTYTYEVSAVDLAGNEGIKSTSASATTLDITPPSQVTGLTANPVGTSQVDLFWDASSESDLDYYCIYRDGILIVTTTATSYSDINLDPATTYNYEVSAVDLSGNEGLRSQIATATTDPAVSAPTIVISEVYYDATGSDVKGEWLELYNYGSTAVDLSGWTLTDNFATWTIPDGTLIQPGQYLVIARDTTGFNALYGFDPDIDGLTLALGNRGDMLTLKDNTGAEIDFVAWENSVSGWDIYASTGTSIARKDATIDTDTVNDWEIVYSGGTPGKP